MRMRRSANIPRQLSVASGNRSLQAQILTVTEDMECPFLAGGRCGVASQVAGRDVTTTPGHCDFCTLQAKPPRAVNQVTVSLAIHAVRDDKPLMQSLIREHSQLLRIERQGPGTELKKLLAWFAVESDSCQCESHATQMDAWGPDGCRERMDTIVGWLLEEAERRGWPSGVASRLAARTIVERAIRRFERKQKKGCK